MRFGSTLFSKSSKEILVSLFFSQIWRMSSQSDEEHFICVLFPFYSIESSLEPHLRSALLLNLCKCILYLFAKINTLILFFKVNVIFCYRHIFSAFK